MARDAPDPARQAGYREGWLTVQDGLRLYYRDYGDPASRRLPVLCLPGLARNSRDFHALALRLAGERRVVCPDYRGRGRSEHAPAWHGYVPQNDLNDLRHLLAATGLHRFAVIGTSYGGLLAMGLAVLAPRGLAGVVLNDIGPDVNPAGQERILKRLGEGRSHPDWPTAVAYLKELLPHLPLKSDEDWLDFARGTYREDPEGGLRVAWDTNIVRPLQRGGGAPPDLWALFRGLRDVPVLVIRGGISDLLTEATVDRMAALHPALMRATVPDVGHAPLLSEPESVQAIDDFLDRLPDPPRH